MGDVGAGLFGGLLGFMAKQQRLKLPPALPKCEPLLQKCGGTPPPKASPTSPAPTKPVTTAPTAPKPKPVDSKDKSNVQDRHTWEVVSDLLGVVGAVAGLAALIPSPIQAILGVVAGVASTASTVISCLLGGSALTSCVVGIFLALVPGLGGAAKALAKGWVKEAIGGVVNAIGASGNAFGLTVSGGDLYVKSRS